MTELPSSKGGCGAQAPRTAAQMYALVAGAVLITLGILSLIFATVDFGTVGVAKERDQFLIWEASGWSAILWILMGGFGLFLAARVDAARSYALVAGVVFAALAIWGFIHGDNVGEILAAGTTDNITHAILGGVGLAVAALPQDAEREACSGHVHRLQLRWARVRDELGAER